MLSCIVILKRPNLSQENLDLCTVFNISEADICFDSLQTNRTKEQWGYFYTSGEKKKHLYYKDMLQSNNNVNSLFILCQVIVHHNHNLLIWDAILVDNLVGMASIGLGEGEKASQVK